MFRTVLSSALMVFLSSQAGVVQAEEQLHRTITLAGHGEVLRVPDTVTISMGVTGSAKTAGEALASNSKNMQAMLAVLKQAGIPDKDIQTTDFSVQPRLDYGNNTGQPPKTVGYDVTNQVTVTLRNIPTLGGILDKAVQSGSNQINGIAFSVRDQTAAMDEARRRAVADAIRKADVYAAAAGVQLGPITSMAESSGYQVPFPMQAKAVAADAAPPIAAGQQALAIDVTISWEIR